MTDGAPKGILPEVKIYLLGLMILMTSACGLPPRKCENPSAPEAPLGPILQQAREADYAGKYDLALELTNKILRFRGDPDLAQAWAIRGSTYYLMGNKKKAKTCWARAYAIDPCIKDIQEMIKSLEPK